MRNNKTVDYYEILEVHRNASYEVINRAYKTLVMKYHPDLNADNIEYANAKMQLLNDAYEVLSDERKRNSYNIIFDAENNKVNSERERERQKEREREKERDRERERENERERDREREKEREREREREKEREREREREWQDYDNRESNEDSNFYKKDVKSEYKTEDNSYEVYNKKNNDRVKSSFGKGIIIIAAVFLIIVAILLFDEDYGNEEVVYENKTVDLEKQDKQESLVSNKHDNELDEHDELDVLSSIIMYLKDQNEGNNINDYIDFTNEFTKYESIICLINTDNLNIQNGPSDNYEIIHEVNKEELMILIGMVNDWYNVYILSERYEGYGWVPIKYTNLFWFDWEKEEISEHVINIEKNLIEVAVNESNILTKSKVDEVLSIDKSIKNEVSEKIKENKENSVESNKQVEKLTFTVGSSKEDVTNAMGTPSSVSSYSFGDTWNYDLSSIEFDTNGKVKGWSNYSNNLKVVLGKGTDNAPRITIGSSKEDVTNAMGTPSSVSSYSFGDTWNYDLSSIEFDTNGKVKGWSNYSNNLKVVLGKGTDNAPRITIGSSKEDVTNAMGTPSSVSSYSFGDTWNYDLSSIEFDTNSKVKGWSNYSNNLKVVLGKRTNNAPGITIGSSKEDVTNAMGTPSSVSSYSFGDTWNYDLSSIEFDTNGKVKGWSNYSNNLKLN